MNDKILVIGSALFTGLFSPLGLECLEVHSNDQAAEALLTRQDAGLLIISEAYASEIKQVIEQVKQKVPVFVLPETEQSFGLQRLENLLTKAIGKRL